MDAISVTGNTDGAAGVEGFGGRPRSWRRRSAVVGAVGLAVAVIVTAAVTVALTRGEGDKSKLRALVQEFATSAEADPFQAATMLCREERETFDQSVNPDLVLPESPTKPEVSISGILIESDLASATIEPPSGPTRRMYFRKENGTWTVCAPAGDPATRRP